MKSPVQRIAGKYGEISPGYFGQIKPVVAVTNKPLANRARETCLRSWRLLLDRRFGRIPATANRVRPSAIDANSSRDMPSFDPSVLIAQRTIANTANNNALTGITFHTTRLIRARRRGKTAFMGIVADSDQCSATTRSLEDAEIQEMELFLFTYGKGLLSWVGAFLFAGFSFLPLALSGHAHVLVIAWTVIMLLMGSLTLYSHCVIQSKCRGMRHALSNGYVIVCLSDNRKTRSADRVEKLSPRGPVWRINNKLADWRE